MHLPPKSSALSPVQCTSLSGLVGAHHPKAGHAKQAQYAVHASAPHANAETGRTTATPNSLATTSSKDLKHHKLAYGRPTKRRPDRSGGEGGSFTHKKIEQKANGDKNENSDVLPISYSCSTQLPRESVRSNRIDMELQRFARQVGQ